MLPQQRAAKVLDLSEHGVVQRMVPRYLSLVAAGGVLAAVGCHSSTAAAQRSGVPQAFAAVQAPEAAVETCHGSSAQVALDCARKRCLRKAGRGACFAVTVCEPAGWSGVMGVHMSEVHFTNAICGAPSRAAVLAALKAFCDGHAGATQCSVARLWSPDGKLLIESSTWKPSRQ